MVTEGVEGEVASSRRQERRMENAGGEAWWNGVTAQSLPISQAMLRLTFS